MSGGELVERPFQVGRERGDGGRLRPRTSGRRHFAAPHFAEHALEERGVLADISEVDPLQRHAAGVRRVVVTGDTVRVHELAG